MRPTDPAVDERLFSCDTLVAVRQGSEPKIVFGKNSDRPLDEAQPLESVPRSHHPAGSHVRCQYLTIPQAEHTLAVLGSRPWWMWGFEHGVNETGVAIGNEAIYTRDDVPEVGLTGMDLVRLGLERGSTAQEAQRVITGLIQEYGQGGDCRYLLPSRYHNSFIIADGHEAYVLETSGRHWVSKKAIRSTAIANLVTIEDDWDTCSDGIERYARENHWWWGPPGRKLNFRAAFEDGSVRNKTEDRYRASCRFLGSPDTCSVESMMRHLRDHFEGGTVQVPETPDQPRPRSICCHPGQYASATAASMVVELPTDGSAPLAWCSMSTPCTSIFLPVQVGSELPARLTLGSNVEDPRSAWWALHRLSRLVELDPEKLTPLVQEVWGACEREFMEAALTDPGRLSDLNALVSELTEQTSNLTDGLDNRVFAA